MIITTKSDFLQKIPSPLMMDVLNKLDDVSLHSVFLASCAWKRFAQEILNCRMKHVKINRWAIQLSAYPERDQYIKEVVCEKNIQRKIEKFLNHLNYCCVQKIELLRRTNDPFFDSCLAQYYQRQVPSFTVLLFSRLLKRD